MSEPPPSREHFSPAARGYLEDHAVDLGLAHELGVRSDRDDLLYPYETPRGESFKRRRTLATKVTQQPKGEPLILWWPAGRPSPGADVLLTEGEPDALSALSALNGAVVAVAALPGTGIPAERVTADLASAGSVYLAFDGDDAGRKCADRLARALQIHTRIRVVKLGEGEDLASRLHGEDDREGWLRAALEKAPEAPKLKLKADPQGYGREKAADQKRDLLARGINPDRLDIGELLDAVRAYIARFVRLTAVQEIAITLWVAHTHAFAASRRTPYLVVTSPREECGKTLLVVEVMAVLVARPWTIEGPPTEAVLFRKIDQDAPTVLFDESESMFASRSDRWDGMRSIVLGGNRRGATVPRCLNRGEELRDYKTYAPKAFAAIKADDWPRTQLSRSIVIRMQRIRSDETVEDFYGDLEDEADSEGRRLHDSLAAWAAPQTEALRAARPERLSELGRRAWEGWVPLLNIADAAGPAWAKRARDAACALSSQGATPGADPDIELSLLAAIRDVFEADDVDRIWTAALLDRLNENEEASWHGWNDGVGIKPREVANKLRPYGIHSDKIRIGDRTRNGYRRERFDDAFARYLAPVRGTSGTSALESQKQEVSQAEQEVDVPLSEGPANPHSKAVVPDVPDRSADEQGIGRFHTLEDAILDPEVGERIRASVDGEWVQ